MEYGVTNKGFVLKRLDVIMSEVQADISDVLGFDVSQNPKSFLNAAFVVPFCDKIAEAWEVLQESYYAKYPSTAEGVNLDNACQYGNIFREGSEPTIYTLHVTAEEGNTENPTVIPKDSIVASITNPVVRLRCAKDFTISREACNNIAIKPVVVQPGNYIIVLNNESYTYSAGSEDTEETIMAGLVDVFNADGYTAEIVEEGNYILITDNTLARENKYELTNNLTTKYVVCTIPYKTVGYGDIQLPQKTIKNVVSNVEGLLSITNLIEPNPGQLQQSDTEFRKSYILKSYANAKMITEAVESFILDEVEDVRGVRCYENDQDEPDEFGRPPHSIEVIVDGGQDLDIAVAILDVRSGGIRTFGDVTVNVLTKYGDVLPVRFNRPEPVYAWIRIEISRGRNTVDPNYQEIVTNYVIENSDLIIGDNFLTQQYIAGIYRVLSGVMYCRIFVAVGEETVKPDDEFFVEDNLIITQRQKVILSASRIEVMLTT